MVAKFKRTRTVSDTTAKSGGDRAPRIDQLVEQFQPKEGVWYELRLVGPMFSYGFHWYEIESKKGKNGIAKFSHQCLAYSDEKETMDSTLECPHCDLLGKGPAIHYYQNVIVRQLEENKPKRAEGPTKDEAKSGFITKDSNSWTPVRVLRLPPGGVSTLRALAELNKHGKKGEKKAYDVSDDTYGCDVMYQFDNSKQGAAKHMFQKGEPTELGEEELEYLLWNIEDAVEPMSVKEAKAETARIEDKMVTEDDDDDGDDYKKSKKKGKKDEDDEDDDEPKSKKRKSKDEDEDEDEDEKPKVKRKVVDDEEEEEEKPKKKRASFDDDDEDDKPKKKSKKDDDEDDEDDAPKSKKKSKKDEDEDEEEEKPKKKRPKDEDEDEEDEPKKKRKSKDDDEDEEDEPKSKKKRPKDEDEDEEEEKPKKKKKADDDEDEDEKPKKKRKSDDDDEDDEPKKKKKKADDDEDEEEEKPKKKGKKDEDDEEDDPKPKKKKPSWDD